MRIDVRPASSGDATACASILQDWLDATPWMPKLHTLTETEAFCRQRLISEQRTVVAGDPVAGFLSLDAGRHLVTALYVRDRQRSAGLGAGLLSHAKSQSEVLDLWTFVANDGACRFYRREGFLEIRRTAGDNEERLPDILFRWSRSTAA